ncbi:MAG: transketolase [Gemmatimonadetes bacterium]|nr:transketolase [Gemmatimonadota bacterium]
MFGMELDELCINTIRMLAVDAVEKAQSGHAGLPMGAAPMAHVLWSHFLKHNPRDPLWPDRDRFVLSAGHGSMLLYSLLHLTGYDLSIEELKNFRQWGSLTPGHPEYELAAGVETTTGPLGQGFSNAVGMAIAERHLAARFNVDGHRPVDHRTFVIASDGDLMEGVASEAASLAGHLALGKLIVLYDDNSTTIDGPTELAFSEDVLRRFSAYGWHTQRVADGTDLAALDEAIEHAVVEEGRPSIVAVRTIIGHGNPRREGTSKAHSDPFGPEEVRLTKENLGWPLEPAFLIPDPVYAQLRQAIDHGEEAQERWKEDFRAFRADCPELARSFERALARELPPGWDATLPRFTRADKPLATREASGKALNALAGEVTWLFGGSADLAPSNKTLIEGSGNFAAANPVGRNLRFGVREHAMGSILNGISVHGGLRPYGGTFLIFSDYMRPAIRLAALMKQPVIYVFTHDSVGLGEDGPTHQPVEQLAGLRAVPNLVVVRPADAEETVAAWRVALERTDGPTALILSRQKVPHLERSGADATTGLKRGGYVLAELGPGEGKDREGRRTPRSTGRAPGPDPGGPDLILIGTGAEVALALESGRVLAGDGLRVRIVSLPSWELFEAQPPEYRESVLPREASARVAVEAASTLGWERYVGSEGGIVGLDRFGASAPGETVLRELGFDVPNVVARARDVLGATAAGGRTNVARAAARETPDGHAGGGRSSRAGGGVGERSTAGEGGAKPGRATAGRTRADGVRPRRPRNGM